MSEKVLAAMSGGVDSSVAALILKEHGYHVVGATMCLGISSGEGDGVKCCGLDGIADARAVCDRLEIPHYVFDFSEDFQRLIVGPFVNEYRAGRTPNPCVRCNELLKFDLLFRKARAMGFDRIATGHYAGIDHTGNGVRLRKGADTTKDQSYFLYRVRRQHLDSVIFPLADLAKQTVRRMARDATLPVAEKAESQDICFVDNDGYRALIGAHESNRSGEIVHVDGRVLGVHNGITNYTIGQRRGLGVSFGEPLYVVRLDIAGNRVIVGGDSDCMSAGLVAADLNMLIDNLPPRVTAKIRYAHAPADAQAEILPDGRLRVRFDAPQRAVTPGQSVVLYDGDVVLCGGIIESATAG